MWRHARRHSHDFHACVPRHGAPRFKLLPRYAIVLSPPRSCPSHFPHISFVAPVHPPRLPRSWPHLSNKNQHLARICVLVLCPCLTKCVLAFVGCVPLFRRCCAQDLRRVPHVWVNFRCVWVFNNMFLVSTFWEVFNISGCVSTFLDVCNILGGVLRRTATCGPPGLAQSDPREPQTCTLG